METRLPKLYRVKREGKKGEIKSDMKEDERLWKGVGEVDPNFFV